MEPHNHRINATKRAIQTFKDAFIVALATSDSDCSLHLWGLLTPQIQDTLNLMRASCINPSKLVYEILNGPYDWYRYPLAPLGCKAVIYEDGDTCGSGASRGVNGWYLGPSKDYYHCDLYTCILCLWVNRTVPAALLIAQLNSPSAPPSAN